MVFFSEKEFEEINGVFHTKTKHPGLLLRIVVKAWIDGVFEKEGIMNRETVEIDPLSVHTTNFKNSVSLDRVRISEEIGKRLVRVHHLKCCYYAARRRDS